MRKSIVRIFGKKGNKRDTATTSSHFTVPSTEGDITRKDGEVINKIVAKSSQEGNSNNTILISSSSLAIEKKIDSSESLDEKKEGVPESSNKLSVQQQTSSTSTEILTNLKPAEKEKSVDLLHSSTVKMTNADDTQNKSEDYKPVGSILNNAESTANISEKVSAVIVCDGEEEISSEITNKNPKIVTEKTESLQPEKELSKKSDNKEIANEVTEEVGKNGMISTAAPTIRPYDQIPVLEQTKLPRGGVSIETKAVGRIQVSFQ